MVIKNFAVQIWEVLTFTEVVDVEVMTQFFDFAHLRKYWYQGPREVMDSALL